MSLYPILAQQQPELPPEALPAILAGMAIVVVIAIIVSLAILAVICYLLYSCFERIPPQHRQMESWQAWLLLIPCFNLVWNFFVYPKLARSYQGYFAEQGRTEFGDCGEQIGLWFAICSVASCIPFVNYIAGPAALVLLIIFLVKALTLKGQIPVQTM